MVWFCLVWYGIDAWMYGCMGVWMYGMHGT